MTHGFVRYVFFSGPVRRALIWTLWFLDHLSEVGEARN